MNSGLISCNLSNFVQLKTESMQYIFNWSLKGLLIAARLFYKGIIYLPLIFVAYLISLKIVSTGKDQGIWMLVLTILFAYLVYLLIFLVKGMMLAMKQLNKWAWLPLFLFLLAFTCVMPAWAVHQILKSLHIDQTVLLIISLSFGVLVSFKYRLLSDWAPKEATALYRSGIRLGRSFYKPHHLH